MVSAGWWLGTPPQQRQALVAGRMLALPDGSWWLFGAWGRWYRWTPADGQWHLCPPPRLTITRMSARPLQQGMPVPQVPPHVVPTGPDLAYDPPAALGFVDAGIRTEVTSRVRATVESAAALPTPDYPHWWGLFSPEVPSTVAVTWGVMLWSATSPVFDSRIDSQLLGLWSAHRKRPLPSIDGPRWLTPPPMESLIGLYTERLRAGRVESAVVVLRTMWAMASAVREDVRFQPRADALIAMLGVTLQNPTVDYGALSYGDQAVVQQWLTRCPPSLAPALRVEASAGEHFRNCYYDLATAVTPAAGDPSERGYVEPRLIAAALLAADLAVVRQEVSSQVIGWLDPQVGEVMRAMLTQPDHPLRRFWPEGDRVPRPLREHMDEAGPAARNTLLATMYGADLAWCRLGGGIPARPRGFPSSVAILAEIIGPRRATSASSSSESASPAPGIAPLAKQYPSNPGLADPTPSVPSLAQRPPTGPPGQAPAWAAPSSPPAAAVPPSSEAWDEAQPGHPESPAWSAGAGAGGGGAGVAGGSAGGTTGTPASPPATEAWSGTAERAPGTPGSPPATEAWSGTGERPPGTPPATQAWSGAEGLEPQAGPGTPGRVTPPPATEAWRGAEAEAPGRPAAPPATRAWSGTGGHAMGPPPATEAWPGSDEPADTSPPPATEAWHGTGPAEQSPPASPPATRVWSGTDAREAGTSSSSERETGTPGSSAREPGRAIPLPPATQAWSGAEPSDTPPPAAQPWPGAERPGTSSPAGQAWSGAGGGATGAPGSGEREPGRAIPLPPATKAWSGAEPSDTPPSAGQGWSGTEASDTPPPSTGQAWSGVEPSDTPPASAGQGWSGVEPSDTPPPLGVQAWSGAEAPDASSPAAQAWSGAGEGAGGASGAGEREAGRAIPLPPVSEPGSATDPRAAGPQAGAEAWSAAEARSATDVPAAAEQWSASEAQRAAGESLAVEARFASEGVDTGASAPATRAWSAADEGASPPPSATVAESGTGAYRPTASSVSGAGGSAAGSGGRDAAVPPAADGSASVVAEPAEPAERHENDEAAPSAVGERRLTDEGVSPLDTVAWSAAEALEAIGAPAWDETSDLGAADETPSDDDRAMLDASGLVQDDDTSEDNVRSGAAPTGGGRGADAAGTAATPGTPGTAASAGAAASAGPPRPPALSVTSARRVATTRHPSTRGTGVVSFPVVSGG